jgi:hypothetical protein
MREIVLGDLSRLKIFDIVKTLLVERKTGLLTIQGKETGEIYFDMGDVVHSKTQQVQGEEAFLTITAWRAGKATFRPDTFSKDKTINIPPEQLLLKWSYRKQEWDKIREVIPSPNLIFRLALQRDSQERHVKADEWSVLALANGMRTVAEIIELSGWNEFKACKTLYQLVQTGLLEKAEDHRQPRRKRVGENFFPTLEQELKRAMGPVAPIIIEDKLMDLGETRDFFPQDQVDYLVEALGEEISKETKRREFVEAMIQFLSVGR